MADELNYAVFNGLHARADALIAAGADVNATDQFGQTPVHCLGVHWGAFGDPAVQERERAMLRLLLDAGVDLAACHEYMGGTLEEHIARVPNLAEELAKWRVGRYTKPARASRR